MPAPLADHLDQLADRIRAAPRVLLFSDFDGTLVPIKEQPSECFLDRVVGQTLSALARQERVAVGVVSGRELEDLRRRVGVDGIVYAGNHGLEIHGLGLSFREPLAVRQVSALDKLVRELTPAVAAISGAWVQHKGLSASVHYRQVPTAKVPHLLEVVRRIATSTPDAQRVVLRHGKMVLEVRPAVDWHKGKAVLWLANKMSPPGVKPLLIYLGDDDTDEDAFAVLPGEITVCVGEKSRTSAFYSVSDPTKVHSFLDWLLRVVVSQ